jgi:integrase
MVKRRGNKEGSIHQRNDGSWRAQVILEGRRLSFSAKTRKECHIWIKETVNQIDDGLSFSSTKMTLDEYLTNWLTSKMSTMRQSTYTHFEHLSSAHIIPYLGKKKIVELRPEVIQGFYNRLREKGIGIPTIEKIHTVLHSALNQAMKMGIIPRNPVSATIPPRAKAKEMKILDDSQVSQMLITAKGHRYEALYHLAVTTGMRQMEILGLKWSDLDWLRKTIRVERQLVRPNGDGIRFSQPKTKYGKREIALGSKTISILRTHYENMQTEIQESGLMWQENNLIFTTSNRSAIHPRNLLRNFKNLLRDSGLPLIRFHDLRHTAATLMLNHGIPVIVVSRRLGHARPSITLDIYGHLLPSMQSEAAELMDELVTPIELHQNCTETAPKLHPLHTKTDQLDSS